MTSKTVFTAFCLFAFPLFGAADRYTQINKEMTDLETKNPDLVQILSIGKNEDGTSINAMRISTTPTSSDPLKLAHLIVATHHGNEDHAPILAMHLARSLAVQYRLPRMLQGRLPETEWMIVPVLNISGYNLGNRNERRQDSNRDYPGPCHTHVPALESVKAMISLLGARIWASTISIHGYLGTLTYPWGVSTTDTKTHDHYAYETLMKDATAFNRYPYGTSTDLVYAVDGSYEDYAYWKHGIWSILVELRDGSTSDLIDTTDALTTFFAQVNSSPSTNHALTGRCQAPYGPDLHLE